MPGLAFISFESVKHGTQDVSGVRRILVTVETDRVSDTGDGQAGPTIVEIAGRRVTGRMELDDVVSWRTLLEAAEADLTFVGEAAGSGTNQDVRIKNVTFGPSDGQWFDGKAPLAARFVLSFSARFDAGGAASLAELLTIQDVAGP